MSETTDVPMAGDLPVPDAPTAAPEAPPEAAAKPAESAPAETHSPDAGADKADKPDRAVNAVQKRISEITAERRRAEREAYEAARERDHWREVALRGAAPKEDAKKPPSVSDLPPDLAARVGAAPNPADFKAGEYDPEYLEARIEYRAELKRAQAEAAERTFRQSEAVENMREAWHEKVSDAARKYPDYEDVVFTRSLSITPAMAEAMTDMDMGADVAYWLGKNPGEARRISGLSIARQIVELGKIEDRIERQRKAAAVSKANPPPKTVSGAGTATAKDPRKMTMDEYAAWRAASSD